MQNRKKNAFSKRDYIFFFDGVAQSVKRLATGWTIRRSVFDSRRGLGIFLFDIISRPALGPTQTPIQWVQGSLSLWIKRPGREADHSLPSSVEVKECVELHLDTNKSSWRGVKYRDNFTFTFTFTRSRVSSVSTALGYMLDNGGSRVRFPEGLGMFLFTTASRTA
jgi:hypothetical protein